MKSAWLAKPIRLTSALLMGAEAGEAGEAGSSKRMKCQNNIFYFRAIVLNAIGLIVILVLAGMTGLTIFALYKDCDILDSKKITKPDQVML